MKPRREQEKEKGLQQYIKKTKRKRRWPSQQGWALNRTHVPVYTFYFVIKHMPEMAASIILTAPES